MKIGEDLYEYWIHKYSYGSVNKRKQFNKLRKANQVTLVNNKEYKQSKYYVYHSTKPIKIVKG